MGLKKILLTAGLATTALFSPIKKAQAQMAPQAVATSSIETNRQNHFPAWLALDEEGQFDEATARKIIQSLHLDKNTDKIRQFFETNKNNKKVDYVSFIHDLTDGNETATSMAKYVQKGINTEKSDGAFLSVAAGTLACLMLSAAAMAGYEGFSKKNKFAKICSLSLLAGAMTLGAPIFAKYQSEKQLEQQLFSSENQDLETLLVNGYQKAAEYYTRYSHSNDIILQYHCIRQMGFGKF